MWLYLLSAVAFAQSTNNSQHPSKGKIYLLNLNNLSGQFDATDITRSKKFAINQVLREGESAVIKLYSVNYQTLFFLNSWWLDEVGKDSIAESLVNQSLDYQVFGGDDYSYNLNYLKDQDITASLPFELLKQWKKTLSIENRRKIQFQSFMSKVETRFIHSSIVVYLYEILKNIKGLDVNVQSQIDAIIATKEIMYQYSKISNYGSTSDTRYSLVHFYQNINQVDTAVNSLIDPKYKKTWKGFVQLVNDDKTLHPNNPWGLSSRYQDEDQSEWTFQMEANRIFLKELDGIVSDTNTYIILVNNEDFYNHQLLPRKILSDDQFRVYDCLYTTLKDLYPSKAVDRYLFRSSYMLPDSINQLDSNDALNDYLDVEFKLIKMDTVNIHVMYINKDSIVNLYQDSGIVEFTESDTTAYEDSEFVGEANEGNYKRIVLESNYKRFYNNINEMVDIINPTEPRMEHISLVGGSIGFSKIRSDGNENVYKFNYHQTYGVESLNNFWGHLIGFQVDGGLYRNKFVNLAFLTNYTYGEFTITKTPAAGDIFVVNPQKLYQVKNSFFTIASGLNFKINLSAIYVHATGGYQWDLSDGRWEYEGNYVNSLGKLKMNGGYFELGVGFNVGLK